MSRVYFNEFDPFAAAWLGNLFPEAKVDSRSIKDVSSADLLGHDRIHLFGGIGGWEYALQLAQWPDDLPIWTGSCPCQPFSAAGKRKGFDDERHLWPEMFRLIRECRPAIVVGEQSPQAIGAGWLDLVFDDLEREGYACGAAVLPACCVGAPHVRQRLWFVAHANSKRLEGIHQARGEKYLQSTSEDLRRHWLSEPTLDRVANGVPGKMGRLRGYGNAIVPQVAAEFLMAVLDCFRAE